jgi:uncharacterized membrane protein YfcA
MFTSTALAYPFLGFMVGLAVGLTGVGGGSLMTPLLVLLFHIHPTKAVGTDLLYAAATKTVGTLVHSTSATVATLMLLYYFGPETEQTARIVTFSLGVALLLTAVSILFRGWVLERFVEMVGQPSDAAAFRYTIIIGLVLGVLVSISSVGAGALGVTALIVLYPRLKLARIVGSDIAHAVPLTLLAGIGHWQMGDVNFDLLGQLMIGSVPGIVLGSYLSPRLPENTLRPVLAAVLFLVGGKLVF